MENSNYTPTGVFLRKDVVILPDIKTAGELYNWVVEGKIAVVSEWLQRLRQTRKWQAQKGEKALSFLSSFFRGNSLITPFYFIHIHILTDYIEQEVQGELNETRKEIFQDLLNLLSNHKKNGVEYILLDGQNRLYEALVMFFDGTLASNQYKKPFEFEVDGEVVMLNDFKYTEIADPRIKDAFYNTQVIIAEGTEGDIGSYIDSIIDLNNGESWSKFETTIIRQTALCYSLNKDIFKDPIIQSLFGNVSMSGNVEGMTGGYLVEKKGDARFLAELTFCIRNECKSGFGGENEICSMLIHSDKTTLDAYNRAKKYVNFIAETFDCIHNRDLDEKQKPLTKESLRGLVLFLDLITNKTNAYYNDSNLKLRSLSDIQSPKKIMESFIRWHNEKVDKSISSKDFHNGKPIPGTYGFATRGIKPENIDDRLKHINDWISQNVVEWKSKSYIIDSVDYKSKEQLLLKQSNYRDIYSKNQPEIRLRDKVHVDHVRALHKGGTNEISNLIVTNPKSNQIKSDRY